VEIVFQDESRGFTRAAEPAFQGTGPTRAWRCACRSEIRVHRSGQRRRAGAGGRVASSDRRLSPGGDMVEELQGRDGGRDVKL
jgi:hypothetical protein